MTKVILAGFKFKAVPKKRTINKSDNNHKITKLVYCVCHKESDGNYVAHIRLRNDPVYPDILSIPFTKESYSLKGKEKIFTKTCDETGRYTCIVRRKQEANLFPGSDKTYSPFRENCVYSGYIVKIKDKLYFDVSETLNNYRYCPEILDSDIRNYDSTIFRK